MGSMSIKEQETNRNRVNLTLGDLVVALYDEAQRVTSDEEEADVLAKASVLDCLKRYNARSRRR